MLAARVREAKTMIERLVGLLATPVLPVGEGLWIQRCNNVHTFFMRYAIDVLFVAPDHTVVATQTLVPWRISKWERKASTVLELPAGAAGGVKPGTRLRFEALP